MKSVDSPNRSGVSEIKERVTLNLSVNWLGYWHRRENGDFYQQNMGDQG